MADHQGFTVGKLPGRFGERLRESQVEKGHGGPAEITELRGFSFGLGGFRHEASVP